MKIADLCAGVGGFHLAFKRLGVEADVACEIDPYARMTYSYNFPNTQIYEDVFKIHGEDLNNPDIICAGFPCQAFSIAGYRKGFEDSRGTIFFEIARLAEESDAPCLFLENVENLVNHDHGNTFKVIIQKLHSLGYETVYSVLESRDYGMYQKRRRIIIVAYKPGFLSDDFNLLLPTCKPPKTFEHLLEPFDDVSSKYFVKNDSNLAENYLDSIVHKEDTHYIYQFRRQYWREYYDKCPTLTANMGTGGHNVPFIFDGRGQSPEGCTGYRKFTPLETFRIQGFDTKGFDYRLPDLSDARLYKQAGNSIPLNMIYEVARKIVNSIRDTTDVQ